MVEHLNIKISGRVQGIGLRWGIKEKAQTLNLKGFAENQNDGTVYIEAEGEGNNIGELTEWLKRGPFLEYLEKIETSRGELNNYNSFDIIS